MAEIEICSKCQKRKGCKAPCWPVELMIRGDSPVVFEKIRRTASGRLEATIWPRSREIPRSAMDPTPTTGGEQSPEKILAFSTENGSPFAGIADHQEFMGTEIFIRRYFMQWTWADIAQAMEITEKQAKRNYQYGITRIIKVLTLAGKISQSRTPEEHREHERQRSRANRGNRKRRAAQRRWNRNNRERKAANQREYRRRLKMGLSPKGRAPFTEKQLQILEAMQPGERVTPAQVSSATGLNPRYISSTFNLKLIPLGRVKKIRKGLYEVIQNADKTTSQRQAATNP